MFDKLVDVLTLVWEWLVPFVVVHTYERGLILRWGNLNKEIDATTGVRGTGFHWLIPFGVDVCLRENVVTDMEKLDPQPLTTKDNLPITIQAALTYRIKDLKKLLLDTEDKEKALHDSAAGIIASLVAQHTWDEIRNPAFVETVYKAVRARGFRYGIELNEVQFPGLQRTRSYTILQPQKKTLL